MTRAGRRIAVGVLALVGAGAPATPARAEETAPEGSVPLVLTGRQTVRADGRVHTIDGKQTIPGGSVIRVEANVRIVGINKASLEVKGGLLVHGTQDCWVRIDNVDFSPTVKPDNEVHLDMADLRDCSFVHADGVAYEGGLTIENSCLQNGCKFSFRIRDGFVRIMTTEFKMPCAIDAHPEKGMRPEVAIRTSWMKEVALSGDAATTVRDAEVRGTLAARDFTDLVVDGCDLFSGATFTQGPDASFSKLQLLKCNLLGGSHLALKRPTGPKTKPEKVRVEKFHFADGSGDPETDDKKVAARIDDGVDDASQSVKAFWQNPAERRHVFLSPTLRKRAPP
jgi:hypothetical protein